MGAGTVLALAIPVLLALAVTVFVVTARRVEPIGSLSRETRAADRSRRSVLPESTVKEGDRVVEPAVDHPGPVLADPEEIGISRRQLFNRGIVAGTLVSSGGLSAAVLAFMWPAGAAGFGSKIQAGRKDDVLATIAETKQPFYVPEARTYLVPYPQPALEKGKDVYDPQLHPAMEQGLVALFQTCTHLGCRVPWCHSSQWFECPCHGSKYTWVGEKKAGPAPRGLDRFPIEFDGEAIVIDTSRRILGPAIGTDTTGQVAEGPHCV